MNGLRVLGARAVRDALPMRAAIDAMRAAFTALGDGTATQPHRLAFPVADRGTAVAMGAFVPALGLVAKVVTVFPGNRAHGLPGTQALCVAFDPATGRPMALLDGTALTARRTGAAAGLATDLLARHDARIGAVIGCGAAGREVIAALDEVRAFDEIRVAARRPEHAASCVAELRDAIRSRLVAAPSAAAAVVGADVVCTATTARAPVFDGRGLAPGCHVNTVGSFRLDMCEVDAATFAGARVFVDSIDAVLAEAGHLLAAERAGATRRDAWTALGDVLRGASPGRASEDEVTVFVSVGQAVQDVAAAARVLEFARDHGLGTEVELS